MATTCSGADRFYFDASAGDGVDALADFSARDDRIFLDRDVFSGLASNGTLTAGGFRLGTEAQDADDRIVYDRASGDIFYDADGAGGADAVLFATVREGLGVTHLDFVGYGG